MEIVTTYISEAEATEERRGQRGGEEEEEL